MTDRYQTTTPPAAMPVMPPAVDVTQNARLERSDRLDGPRYASLAIIIAGVLAAGAYHQARGLTPDNLPIIVYGILALSAVPWLIYGWLAMRETVNQFRLASHKVHWTETRLRKDIDGDGLIGPPPSVAAPRDDWFIALVRHWYAGGNTAKHQSIQALDEEGYKITQAQWQAAQRALVAAGIMMSVRKRGGAGCEMKYHRTWDEVLRRLPPTPEVTQ